MPPNQSQAFAVPTTNIWDVSQVYSTNFDSPDQIQELFVRLYQNLNNISLSLNARDAGYYDTMEFLNSQVFFPNPALNSSTATTPSYRSVFRKVINFGILPNAAGQSQYLMGSCALLQLLLPESMPLLLIQLILCIFQYHMLLRSANNIALNVDGTNVNITVG